MIYSNEVYEKNLIGAILSDTSLLEQLKVKHDQLQGKVYKNVLQAIVGLYNDTGKVDEVSVFEKVKDKSNITLSDIVNMSAGAIGINSKTFDGIQNTIIEAYNKKNVEVILLNALNDIQRGVDYEKVKNDLKDFCINNEQTGTKIYSLGESVASTIEIVEKRIKGEIKGMYTGFESMDNCLHGIQKKNFYVIGARPSVGKTAFALSLGERLGIENKGIFFSLEMSKEQLCERIIADKSNCKMDNLIEGTISEIEMNKILDSFAMLPIENIDIVEDEYMTIEELERTCRKVKRERGLDWIVIDYLTLLHAEKKFNTLREEINYISRSLKILSNKLDIAVICLTQLNRAVESRADNTPMMSDIRESGQIEQDANVILFLSRPLDINKLEIDDFIRVDIKKNRNGKANIYFHLHYDKDTQSFTALNIEQEKGFTRNLSS